MPIEYMIDSKYFCACTKRLGMNRVRAGVAQCAECDASVVDRVEHLVRPILVDLVGHQPSAMDDTLFGQGCDVMKRRRPDFMWSGSDRVVIVEVDERGGHSDSNYTPECDLGWVMDMTAAIVDLYRANGYNEGNVPHVIVVRFNPDECDVQRVGFEERLEVVAERVRHYMTADLSCDARPILEYHFYHSKCQRHKDWALANPEAVRVITS